MDPDEQPAPVQRSLFPDAFEVQARCLSALRDLDVSRARTLLERMREQNPRLVNLGVLDQALGLLESVLESPQPGAARLAELVRGARDRYLAGRLSRPAAEFVDQTIARYWRRHGSPGPFLDQGERVHRGVLDLVLGNAATAHRHLAASLQGGFQDRADLWGYLGDACLGIGREDKANACYVRGLLLSAADVDLMRNRLRQLAHVYEKLCETRPENCARELLIVHAWLDGLLEIPPENGWLDGYLSRLMVRAHADPSSPPHDRYRKFGLLLYLDRSQAPGSVDMARRDEMAALEGDLFARYIHECRERERSR